MISALAEHHDTIAAIAARLAACLDGIRRAQSQRGDKRRLAANRVVLYVWPVADVPSERFSVIAQNAARLTVGAGLEEITGGEIRIGDTHHGQLSEAGIDAVDRLASGQNG